MNDTRNEACVTWERGPLKGSLPHDPLPHWALGDTVGVGCERCGKDLYTYKR